MSKKSIKSTRINEEVYREISNILRGEVKDPRISPIVSVTRTEVTTDLKQAKIYVSVLGDEEALARTMEGLKSSNGFIRNRLAANLNLRNTPELIFIADDSIAYGIRMSKLIDEVNHGSDDPEEE
ncbi:MAG: 30S ribosome-binding factor RbfA [Lachnospiraceae bacterium]|nr:30S ribosome-binding factor RbfA [Lachnospiraceae bacterium]